MDLENSLDTLLKKGDREDVLKAMLKYRWLCEGHGMTQLEIKKEFIHLINRVMRKK